MNVPLWAQLPLFLLLSWLFTAYLTRTLPTLRNKRVLLLIAHPDDEAMFFAPTLAWLTRPELGNAVMVFCLSSGDADGLGGVRKGELVESAVGFLGVRRKEEVVVLEDEKLRDGMGEVWDAKYIASVLEKWFIPAPSGKKSKSSSSSRDEGPKANIDVLLTFDAGGISAHPNHIALFAGAQHFLRALRHRHPGWESPITLYTLTTTNLLRKYASILDAPLSVLASIFARKEKGEFPAPLLIVSGLADERRAQKAMTQGHKSQMRWFRWGWIGVSRYMVINDLRKVKVV